MDTPLYGGEKNVKIESRNSISNGDSSNTSFLKFPSHTGTHIDFPKHFSEQGKTINDYRPEFWIFEHPFVLNYYATENEIITFCKEHVASYKAPKSVEFTESLPKNPQGKILKKEIRAKYWADKNRYST